MFDWMAWTPVTAAFFGGIAFILVVMGALELVWPTRERKAFLPIPTTRGDRLFIGLLSSAFVHLGWLALAESPLYIATILCVIWVAILLRWA
jgi:predicted small integral membrane protein